MCVDKLIQELKLYKKDVYEDAFYLYCVLLDELKYDGIYRDDGILVFQGKKTTAELEDRLVTFQEEAKNLLGEKFLKFTMDIWDPDATLLPPSDAMRDSKTITTNKNKKEGFPYLDIWNSTGEVMNYSSECI